MDAPDRIIAVALLRAAPPADPCGLAAVRIAVACMTRQPLGMAIWLAHHAQHCQVSRFYIRVEATPELRALFDQSPWCDLVRAEFIDGDDCVRDNGSLQANRQGAHVNESVVAARAEGYTHLLHIDDDELLYLPAGGVPARTSFS